jgi:hypothetical protein
VIHWEADSRARSTKPAAGSTSPAWKEQRERLPGKLELAPRAGRVEAMSGQGRPEVLEDRPNRLALGGRGDEVAWAAAALIDERVDREGGPKSSPQ